jgi:hypothetical protein
MRRISILLLLGLLAVPVDARKLARPPTPEELSGRWAGYTEDDLSFVHCELSKGGAGRCVVTWLDSGAKLYRLHSWSLKAAAITFDIRPVDAGAYPVFLRGMAGSQLHLVIGGTSPKWQRKLNLYRTDKLQADLAATAARLDSESTSGR